mgnify:CR=1 FL=1
MRQLTVIFFLLSIINGFSQSISDLYLLIPEEYSLGLSKDERKSLINVFEKPTEFKKNAELNYRIEELDVKNGYMRVSGAFEGIWEMCYWNLNDKSKMLATTMYTCGPLCMTEYIKFYHYNNGQIIEIPFGKVIPNSFFIDLITLIKEEKTIKDIRPLYEEPIAFVYYLPRKGKNIRVEYQGVEYFEKKYLKSLLKGDNLELEWTGDKFIKGQIYFQE